MSMLDWAKKEVELACKRENPDWDGESFDYGCSCYKSALKAYESLVDDNHSGMSWGITRNILIRLMNNQVLTPIEDTEDIWAHVFDSGYQCKRMPSLFKYIDDDGSVTYSDNDRAYGLVDNDDLAFCSGRVINAVNSLFPIEMPYCPDTNKYKVLFHDDGDEYPYAIITPDGNKVNVRYSEDKGLEQLSIDKAMIHTLVEENEKLKADNKILAEKCLKDLLTMCKDCAKSKILNDDFEGYGLVCSRFGRMAVNPDFYCADFEKRDEKND